MATDDHGGASWSVGHAVDTTETIVYYLHRDRRHYPVAQVSQRSRYALRALFELAKHHGGSPAHIGDIARAQEIPQKFLAAILSQLKQAGLVTSTRGRHGGYALTRRPEDLSVGELLRVTEGPAPWTACSADGLGLGCPLGPDCVFQQVWRRADEAMMSVYDSTTFRDLLELEAERNVAGSGDYSI